MTSPALPAARPAPREDSVRMWRRITFRVGGLALLVLVGATWSLRGLLLSLAPAQAGTLLLIAACVGVLALGGFMLAFVVPTVSRPAERLADVAEAIAEGDLTRSAGQMGRGGIRRLSTAVDRMQLELRTLARALRDSSAETAALAHEISTGAEHMAGAAEQMAATSNELSRQSTEMAQTIQRLANDAGAMAGISEELSAGAHEGVERNARLRELSIENRRRLDASTHALETLAGEVQSSAAAVEALAAASEEIRAFVGFVQKMARQSKLLALNAAMEAARAGEHGQGFAVVASEVRRLAAGAGEAAERTEAVVKGVLAGIAESRTSSTRAVATVTTVLEATREALHSFTLVEEGVAEVEAFTAAIDAAAGEQKNLALESTRGLDELSRGTEAFAAAMQEVAASSQEQSASTEEIAAAAQSLSKASEKLSQLVATFRTEGDDEVELRLVS
jgi:methyl-accepting chemotaxis protein